MSVNPCKPVQPPADLIPEGPEQHRLDPTGCSWRSPSGSMDDAEFSLASSGC